MHNSFRACIHHLHTNNHPIMNVPDTLCDSPQQPLSTPSPASSTPPPHASPHSSALALDQALQQLRHHKETGGNLKHHQWMYTKDRQRLRLLQQDSAALQTLLVTLSRRLDEKMWARRTLNQTNCTARHQSPNLHRDVGADGSHMTANHPMQVSSDIMTRQRGLDTGKRSSSDQQTGKERKRHTSYAVDSGESELSDFPMLMWSDSDSESCSSNHLLPHNQQLAASQAAVSGANSPIGADVPSPSRRLDTPRLDYSSDVYSTPQESLWNELEQPEWNEPAEHEAILPDSSSGPAEPTVVNLSKFISHAASKTPVTGLLLETPGDVQSPKPTVDTTDTPGRVTAHSEGVPSDATPEIKGANPDGDRIEPGKYMVEPVMVNTAHGVGEWLEMERLIFHQDSIFANSILTSRGISVKDLRREVSINLIAHGGILLLICCCDKLCILPTPPLWVAQCAIGLFSHWFCLSTKF